MSNWKKYFYKAGGWSLIKHYLRGGVLSTAIMQFLTLGKSKTALEILRMSISLKIKQKFVRKYHSVIDDFDKSWDSRLTHNINRTIWLFWWQGIDNAPELVKVCYESVKRHHGSSWKIVLLSEQNYKEYVTFPAHIIKQFKSGIISITHLSDMLRLELLIKYGGLWIDATVLCTGNEIPKSIFKSDLFVFQAQKPGADGMASLMSNWLMYAKTNQRILHLTLTLIYEYWKRNNFLMDYFFFHKFFTIACETYPNDAAKIPPFCNSVPHILQLHLFDKYDEIFWEDLKKMTCFHKLTYKLDTEKCKEKGTYFDMLIHNDID